MNYRSIEDLNKAILNNIHKFPRNIDLIVGIPRSGMLPANLLALYLNKPYTDIESFKEGKIYSCGVRGSNLNNEIKTVLVVDDSFNTGLAMGRAKNKLRGLNYKFIYSAIFSSQQKPSIDVYCEYVPMPRIFQWNLFHHGYLTQSCMDIDGVLCRDPTPEENDDGEKYHKFLISAEPRFIPSVKIKTLITCRLSKYRLETEFWLKKHNVKYDNLIMLNLPDKKTRQEWGKYGEFKASEFEKPYYRMFVESSLNEAKTIFNITHKPVFCVDEMIMLK